MLFTQVTFDDFWTWLQKSDSYRNKFSLEGAKALFEYMDEVSDNGETDAEQLLRNIEGGYDPMAWCIEWTEYDNLAEFNKEYNSDNPFDSWNQVEENTTVIKLDEGTVNDGAIVADF